jgi:ubiquinone/menaquinone biosynthesis C-methylase UbiE
MTNDILIFNRNHVRSHRNRAAGDFAHHDFMFQECAKRLAERLPDFNKRFPMVLDIGAHTGALSQYITGLNGIEHIAHADISQSMVAQAKGLRVVADEEFLPFAVNSFDLVLSVFSLHWINDLPGALIQLNRVLKPDGLFMMMVPGGETLKECRASFEQAELAATGGMSPRISPFIDAREAGSLLTRAGFVEPVTDSDIINVHYENPMKLLDDLRGSGESNALITRHKGCLRRDVLYAAMEYYQKHFAHADGRVNATCELVTMTGWKPADKPHVS